MPPFIKIFCLLYFYVKEIPRNRTKAFRYIIYSRQKISILKISFSLAMASHRTLGANLRPRLQVRIFLMTPYVMFFFVFVCLIVQIIDLF